MSGSSRVVAVALALILLPVGCSQGGAGESKTKNALTIAITAEPIKWLNPANDNSSPGIEVARAMFAPLVDTDPDTGKLRNIIAESVTPDATSRTWTIKLKSGQKFQNGQTITAKDYVDTWNLTAYGPNAWQNNGFFSKVEGYDDLNPAAPAKPTATAMSGLKVVDDRTFTVRLKNPFSQFGLTLQYLGLAPLAEVARKDPKAYERKQIGMGPYKLDGEWKVGEDIKLTKWSGYQGEKPQADRVTFRFIANGDTAYNEFLAGTVDFVQVPATKKRSFKTDAPGRWLVSQNAGNIFYWAFPSYDADFANPKLRHAFSMAIDRKALANLVGIATPAGGLAAPGIPGARPDACKYCTYDPAAAKKLYAESGGLHKPLTIYYNTTNSTGQIFSEALGNMVRQHLGIEVKYIGKQASEITDLATARKLHGVRIAGWGHDYPSIEDYLTPMFKSSGDANFASYANPKVDALLAQGDSEPDQAKAVAVYQQAEDLVLEDMPLIPLWHNQDAYLSAKGVHPRNSKFTGVWPLWSTIDR
ncbi:MAG: oligopeptide transport system substrate-binding protein [Cryptosporangiaceae bacterium]|nr:oligopeptide transport system substrate-binding protein [Cryptosporangiaceae bacterium]